MICGDGDFRVNLRKRHEVDPRWEFRVFEHVDGGEKYRGVSHAELKWIVNHRRTMPSVCLEASSNPRGDPIPHIFITFLLHYSHTFSHVLIFIYAHMPFHPPFHCAFFCFINVYA